MGAVVGTYEGELEAGSFGVFGPTGYWESVGRVVDNLFRRTANRVYPVPPVNEMSGVVEWTTGVGYRNALPNDVHSLIKDAPFWLNSAPATAMIAFYERERTETGWRVLNTWSQECFIVNPSENWNFGITTSMGEYNFRVPLTASEWGFTCDKALGDEASVELVFCS